MDSIDGVDLTEIELDYMDTIQEAEHTIHTDDMLFYQKASEESPEASEWLVPEGEYPPDDFWVEAYEQEENYKIMQLVESLFEEFEEEEKNNLYMNYETQDVVYQDVCIPLTKIIEDGEEHYLDNLMGEINTINYQQNDIPTMEVDPQEAPERLAPEGEYPPDERWV